MNGESKARRTSSQTTIPGTVPYTPAETILCNRPDTNSIVCADISLYSIMGAINSHTVRPPTCLWASTVLWVPRFIVPSEHGETPNMPLGINSICRSRHLPYPNKTTKPPTCIRHPTVLSAPTIIPYPLAWATRLRSIRTLSLSLVRPSPSYIKGDVLSPNIQVILDSLD